MKRSRVGESKSISMSEELLNEGLWLGDVLKSKNSFEELIPPKYPSVGAKAKFCWCE